MNYWSPTQSSVYQLVERYHGCTRAPKNWHLIDYFIVWRKDRQDVRVTKTMCGADCWTDHRLIVSKLNLRIQPVRQPQGKEVPKKNGCLQAERRQQEASVRQRSLQSFRCTGTQFRRCRQELDSLQRYRSLFSNGFPRTSILQTPRLVWWEWQNKIQGHLEEKHQKHKAYLRNTSSVSSKTAIQTYARQYTLGSETCKTPGWEKRLMKSSPVETERIWRSSLMHSRQCMAPRAQEPSHFLVQMVLVFRLTKKPSWKDGLNILMVSLIGHHLSMMKLSTDYNRWNVGT